MKLGISTYSLYGALARGEMTIQDVIVFIASIGAEHRVIGEVFATGDGAKSSELPVVADRQDQVTFAAGKHLIGSAIGVCVAAPTRRLAREQVVHVLVGVESDSGVQQS